MEKRGDTVIMNKKIRTSVFNLMWRASHTWISMTLSESEGIETAGTGLYSELLVPHTCTPNNMDGGEGEVGR